MGKESKKEWIYVYVLLLHFAVQQKLTQHCKSTILQSLKMGYLKHVFKLISPVSFNFLKIWLQEKF